MYGKRYTTAQKLAYYKAKSSGASGRKALYTASRTPYNSVRGSGDYLTRFRNNYRKPYRYPGAGGRYGAAIGSTIGNLVSPGLGGVIGGGIGRGLGRASHAAIKTVTGFGDYSVSQNSLVFNRDAVPEFSNNERCTHIKHKEFVGDIRSSVAFALSQYEINPANPILFPWLSGIAQNYEQWVCQGMIFQFKTTSATAVASTNTALGTVIMATQYNSVAPPFINKVQMENYEFAQSGVPCESMMHPVECDPKQTMCNGMFYVNNDGYNAQADPRLYNIGTFNIASVGAQAASTCGELWVTYDICFLKPKLTGNPVVGDHWTLAAATVAPGVWFGVAPALSNSSTSYSNVGTTEAVTALLTSPWNGTSGTGQLYINPNYVGNLIISYFLVAPAGVAYADPVFTLTGNITLNSSFINVVQKFYSAATNTGIQATLCITCAGGVNGVIYPTITLSGGLIPNTTATVGGVTIMSVPASLTN